ncbi:hypothetical protein [Natrinema caseinilyticum]|uniref:hypothetical protein n=1 Tax=Natrinema caseinilyticum TaxID=2961570 RepID=UPI0020C4A672|nr:hypothetical protein [Natrinema caseinilyticum]
MTPRDHDRTRVRLEEVRADLETLDGHLVGPLTLEPAIETLETTIDVYDGLETDGDDRPVAAND